MYDCDGDKIQNLPTDSCRLAIHLSRSIPSARAVRLAMARCGCRFGILTIVILRVCGS